MDNSSSFLKKLKQYKYLWYALASVGFSAIIDLLFGLNETFLQNHWLSFVTSSFIIFVIALAIDLILFLTKRSKKSDAHLFREKLNQLGSQYKIPNNDEDIPMFSIPDVEYGFIKSEEKNTKYAIGKKINRPAVYYSLSVKKYLNWIDYTFFSYLKTVKKKTGCEIIIALHYNDQMRAAKQANSNTNKYYKSIAKWYAGIVYKIIGEDTKVIYEDDFYKYYAKEYSNEYHKHYLEQIQQGSEILADSKESSSSFKRKLSNIESYFPVYMLAKKLCKRRQLYVLDRDKCLEDWVNDKSSNILQEIKKKYGFILLTAKTLTSNGNKIDVHSMENTPNLTDSEAVLKEKLHRQNKDYLLLLDSLLFSTEVEHYIDKDQESACLAKMLELADRYDIKAYEKSVSQ